MKEYRYDGNKKVVFTLHAEDKLKRLMKIGVTKEKVLKIIENPVKVVNVWTQDSTGLIKRRFN